MPQVKNVEKKIWDIEGFSIIIKHPNGVDVRGNKQGIPQYRYKRAAKNDMTIAEWKQGRFKENYPGFNVAVLDGYGIEANGQMKLGTLRDTYIDEEEMA